MRVNRDSVNGKAEVTPLLKVEDVARRLGLSALTIYSWSSQGKIKSCRVGRQLRFEREAVEELIQRRGTGEV